MHLRDLYAASYCFYRQRAVMRLKPVAHIYDQSDGTNPDPQKNALRPLVFLKVVGLSVGSGSRYAEFGLIHSVDRDGQDV